MLRRLVLPLIVGFDHAVSGGDESVAWVGVVINDVLREVECRVWHNTLIHDQVQELAGIYPDATYCIDATAEGGKEALGIFQRAGLHVRGIDFGKAKHSLMINLKNCMQQGRTKFADEGLRTQLSHYKFRESNVKGRYRFGEKGTPDDRVDAYALAVYAFDRVGRGPALLEAEW